MGRLGSDMRQAGQRPVLIPSHDVFKISQIRTLASERIGHRLARVTDEELAWVVEGLNEIIGT